MSNQMEIFKSIYGKKLEVGDQVEVDRSCQYWPDFHGEEWIVTGMHHSRRPDTWDITICEKDDYRSGGYDGFALNDIKLVAID